MRITNLRGIVLTVSCFVVLSCKEKHPSPSPALISALELKRGQLISCGPSEQQFGSLSFAITGNAASRQDFTLGLKLLHSFEYDEAEKVFARIIDQEPGCMMAYWGVAMSLFHPLWTAPLPAELKKGAAALAIARSLPSPTPRESGYVDAIASFYTDWDKVDHQTRCLRFEQSMKALQLAYPEDKEAEILYALALDAAADPGDKTYQKQKQAGTILNALYASQPDHPGVVHYLIHTYDAPELASQALTAARRYASVAPSSAHALHMPSHIFTRLGLWEEGIQSNLGSVASAQCYAQTAGIKGHWDEELHGLDYLVYGYLQTGDNQKATAQLQYLHNIREVHPANFKVAYAFAAIPSRIVLENKRWSEAAALQAPPANFSWSSFPLQEAMLHFTRAMGMAHTGELKAAQSEIQVMQQLRDTLLSQKDAYKANQVLVQVTTAKAWLHWKAGHKDSALQLMRQAAELEDKTEKHPVTPGEVLPARELLGDLLLELNDPVQALAAYEANLEKRPNRFNGLYGAGLAAQKAGDTSKAGKYYRQLLSVARNGSVNGRPELAAIKKYLN
jgi:tetratricopeptide (TPR) repeat protein